MQTPNRLHTANKGSNARPLDHRTSILPDTIDPRGWVWRPTNTHTKPWGRLTGHLQSAGKAHSLRLVTQCEWKWGKTTILRTSLWRRAILDSVWSWASACPIWDWVYDLEEVNDDLVVIAGVSVTWKVLSWFGGHEFKPQLGRTWGEWYFCPVVLEPNIQA